MRGETILRLQFKYHNRLKTKIKLNKSALVLQA